MSKRYFFTGVVFLLWILGFYLVTDFTGDDIIKALSSANPLSFLGGVFLYLIAVSTGAYVLYSSLKKMGVKPPVRGVYKAWIFGSFIDNIAPTITPVGEASMAFFLERFYRVSYAKSLASIGMYVSSWGISVSVFATASIVLVTLTGNMPEGFLIPVAVVVGLFSLITVGWLLLLTKKSLIKRIVCKFVGLYNRIHNRIKRRNVTYDSFIVDMEFEQSYSSLEVVMKNKMQVLKSVLVFFLPQLAHIGCIYIVILGFGVEVSFFSVMGIQIVATVIGLLSLIPSGLGVYEGVSVGALALSVGIPESVAFSAIFIYRLIFLWGTNLLGGIIGIVEGIENPGKMPAN